MTYFCHLLRAVPARHIFFMKCNTLYYVKTFKTTCYLGVLNIQNVLNLENLVVKNHNCTLLLDFVALFCYTTCMSLFFKISPVQLQIW